MVTGRDKRFSPRPLRMRARYLKLSNECVDEYVFALPRHDIAKLMLTESNDVRRLTHNSASLPDPHSVIAFWEQGPELFARVRKGFVDRGKAHVDRVVGTVPVAIIAEPIETFMECVSLSGLELSQERRVVSTA